MDPVFALTKRNSPVELNLWFSVEKSNVTLRLIISDLKHTV